MSRLCLFTQAARELCFIIIYLYLKNVKELKNNYSNYYQLDIYLKDQTKISLTGFVDTGNNLKDPYTRSPIIIVNQSKVPPQEHYLLVPYQVVNHEELLKSNKIYKEIYNSQTKGSDTNEKK